MRTGFVVLALIIVGAAASLFFGVPVGGMSVIGIGIAAGVMLTVVIALLVTVARCYKKVSPNQVAVITGGNYKGPDDQPRGFRSVVGGGFFLVPIIEKMDVMSLNTIPVPVRVENVPDKHGALVTVDAIANVKILSSAEALPLAIERFLGKGEDHVKNVAQQTLEGNLRGIIGTMEVESLLRDREQFTQNTISEAGTDLGKMGLGVDTLKIQNITDVRGYIEALGKKRTAEVVRDATIGEAEAKRDADIKSAEARRAGEIATAEADKAISDARRGRDMAIADNDAQVGARQAQVPIAAQIAQAQRTKELNVETIAAEKAQVSAQIELEGEEAKRHEAHLNATAVVAATKAAEARLIEAEAARKAAELEGEAGRVRQEKDAAGRKLIASAQQAEQEAIANGEKANLLAAAAGKQADLEAIAAGERAAADALKMRLLAEAEGIDKKAEAFSKLDDTGKMLLVLEALPPVIAAAGAALEKVASPVAEAIGEGLGNIGEVRIFDFGGGKADGSNVLAQFANMPVETILKLGEQAKAAGLGSLVEAIGARVGIELPHGLNGAGKKSEVIPAAAQPSIGGPAQVQ